MLAILLSLLFAATALAALATIHGAVRKGLRAFTAIQRELAQHELAGTVDAPVRLRRPVVVTAGRGSRRTVRASSPVLCAAA